MSRREQLLGLGDSLGSSLGEKVPSKKAEDSPTYWPAAAQTTKLPDQLGYLIKHPDGKLEVHSSMAWRLSNSKPELLWDDSFADNRFTIGVDLSAQGLETWCQLRAQNESMNRLAQEASGIIQGQLGKAIGGVNSPDLGLVQFQAQSRQVQRALGNSQHSQEALDEAEHDRRRMACLAKEYDECKAKKAAERDATLASLKAMIPPRQDAFQQPLAGIFSQRIAHPSFYGG